MWRAVLLAILVGCGGSSTPDPDGAGDPPIPAGCIDDVATGDHTYSCNGLTVDARVPAACQAAGCGLILVLHGDTGNGLLMDAHVKMRDLGEQPGPTGKPYVVVAPTGPDFSHPLGGSTWTSSQDATLVDIVEQVRDVFRVDEKRIHVTGFSRGGFVTWRLLCDHADLFASAAPAGAGFGSGFGEQTCFQQNRAPSRPIPIAFLMGRTDVSVGYQNMAGIRDAAIAEYGATGPTTVTSNADYRHDRWAAGDVVIETFDHAYETVADGPWASAQGHCIAGSTSDPYAPQYAIPCVLPNAFTWGDEVMAFFHRSPLP